MSEEENMPHPNPFFEVFAIKPPTPEQRVDHEKKRFGRLNVVRRHLEAAREALYDAGAIDGDERIRGALRKISGMLSDIEMNERRGPQV